MEHSDEPFFIAAKILKESSINIIVDGGASIGDTSLRLSELFAAGPTGWVSVRCIAAMTVFHSVWAVVRVLASVAVPIAAQ